MANTGFARYGSLESHSFRSIFCCEIALGGRGVGLYPMVVVYAWRIDYWLNQSSLNSKEGVHMPLIDIIITLIVTGIALWAINTYIPMAAPIKKIINIVITVVVCLWLLQEFGVIGSLRGIHVS